MSVVSCFDSCFLLLLESVAGNGDFENLRQEMTVRLTRAETEAAHRCGSHAAARCLRLVEVWADETILVSNREARTRWMAAPLQSTWAEGRRGGVWFFEEAKSLSPNVPEDAAVAAVALRCLGMGFQGRLHDNPHLLRQFHNGLARRFGHVAPDIVFPPPVLRPPRADRMRRLAVVLLLLLMPTLILGGLWAVQERRLENVAASLFRQRFFPDTPPGQPLPNENGNNSAGAQELP